MNPNGNTTSTAETAITPAGATVGASPAPEQQNQDAGATALALSEILAPGQAEGDAGQQGGAAATGNADPQSPSQGVSRDRRAVEGRHKEDIRKAERDGYNRAMTELEGRFSAMLDAKLAPYQAAYEQQAAQAILQEHPNISPEIAKELAQARAAKALSAQREAEPTAPPASQQAPQRDAQGRFVSQQQAQDGAPDGQAAMQQRVESKARQLQQQAGEIQKAYGIDMLALFQTDEEIKRGIIEEDRDFYWGLMMLDKRDGAKPSAPPVVRNANFTGNAGTSFADMPSDQFGKVMEGLRGGQRIDLNR